MKESIRLNLVKVARKQGGDRYEDEKYGIVFYIPQTLSRVKGAPVEAIEMTLEHD